MHLRYYQSGIGTYDSGGLKNGFGAAMVSTIISSVLSNAYTSFHCKVIDICGDSALLRANFKSPILHTIMLCSRNCVLSTNRNLLNFPRIWQSAVDSESTSKTRTDF